MKKLLLSLISGLLLLLPLTVFASSADEDAVFKQVSTFTEGINLSDVELIHSTLSPNMSEESKNEITELTSQGIFYIQNISEFETLENGSIQASGRFSAEGVGWSISGFKSHFTYENIDGEWLLVQTDIVSKMSTDGIFTVLITVMAVFIPVMFLGFGFWLWMLIDAIQRPIENKTMWVLLLIFFQVFAAVIYFFAVRRPALNPAE